MFADVRRLALLCILAASTFSAAETPCSFTKTNKSCDLKLDRNSFVFPAPLQMYPKSKVTIYISDGKNYEQYTLDPAPGQANLLPDVTSTALGNINTIFAAAGAFGAQKVPPPPQTDENFSGRLSSPCLIDNGSAECKQYEVTHPCYVDVKSADCERYLATHPCDVDLKSADCAMFNIMRPCDVDPTSDACKIFQVMHPCQVDAKGEPCKKYRSTDPCEKEPNTSACRDEKDTELIMQVWLAEKKKGKSDDKKDEESFNQAINKNNIDCKLDHLSQFSSEDCMLNQMRIASQLIVNAAASSKTIYAKLNTYLTPDSQPALTIKANPLTGFIHLIKDICGDQPSSNMPCGMNTGSIHDQLQASAAAGAVLSRMTKPPTDVNVPTDATYPQPSQTVLNGMLLLSEEQAALDAIRKDLEGYAARLNDLVLHLAPAPDSVEVIAVGVITDPYADEHVTRTVNYTLNRLNMVSNSQEAVNDGSKKVPIVTISLIYGETHWEASTGIALAFRPIRTFPVVPTISGVAQTGSYIGETKAGPEVVPFVVANYRPFDDFDFGGWRGAIYVSGGIGYNTSQQSADYLFGPSISWRGVLLSALCDYGHGTRLTQGLTVGQQLGTATTTTAVANGPTANYWVPAFTIGISVRIPGIAGR